MEMTPSTDTPQSACPHCGAEVYALLGLRDNTTYWECNSDLKSDGTVVRSELCQEREARKKAETELTDAKIALCETRAWWAARFKTMEDWQVLTDACLK